MFSQIPQMVLGYITRDSNEVSMLKSIVRFARDKKASWRLVYLQQDEAEDEPDSTALHIRTVQDMCQSLGGDCIVVDTLARDDFLKLHLFEIGVKGRRVARILVDNTLAKMAKRNAFFDQLKQNIDQGADLINIENKSLFVTPYKGPIHRAVSAVKRFFVRGSGDIMMGLLFGLFAVLITYGVHFTINHRIVPVDDSYTYMVFILAANLCALRAGIWGGVACTLVTSLAANYFFFTPYYHFKLDTLSDMINWLVLVITSSVTSVISALMIIQQRRSRREERNQSLLLDINMTPLKHRNMTTLLQDLRKRLRHHLQTDIVFFVPTLLNDNRLEMFAGEGDIQSPPDADAVQAIWMDIKQGYAYSYQDDTSASWVYLPLSTLANDVGVLAVRKNAMEVTGAVNVYDYKKLSDMIAGILEYINLDQEMHARDVVKEKDKLRIHILSSVSHDLKTPLAAIIGSLGLYLGSYKKLKEEQVVSLIENAHSEANRLDGFITNILAMTKLEAGLIRFNRESIGPRQLISNILDKVKWRMPDGRLDIRNIDFRETINVDVAATELVLMNLIDNAMRYSPPDEKIILSFSNAPTGYSLTIINKGPPIDGADMETIFDKYVRLQREDSQKAATGLGLALCRGLMQGQGGAIAVRNGVEGVEFGVFWPET